MAGHPPPGKFKTNSSYLAASNLFGYKGEFWNRDKILYIPLNQSISYFFFIRSAILPLGWSVMITGHAWGTD